MFGANALIKLFDDQTTAARLVAMHTPVVIGTKGSRFGNPIYGIAIADFGFNRLSGHLAWCYGAPCIFLSYRIPHTQIQPAEASRSGDAWTISTGCPASAHATTPPNSGRIFLKPARLKCLAAVAADASFGHEQYTTISVSRG